MKRAKAYDLVIVGGAAAGLTAAIYAARRGLNMLVVTKDIGGQAALAPKVENYPGFAEISGLELMNRFYEQAKKSGANFAYEEVIGIEEAKEGYFVKTSASEYKTSAVILALGKTPRSLGVPGEAEFTGKGVSYCATCDMPLFAGKTIAVVGGGNSALDAALYGADIAKKVYLIHRRDEFRGFEYLVERAKARKNIELVLNTIVKEIKGDKFVKSILVENVKTGKKAEMAVDGIFIEVGYETKTDFLKGLVKIDNQGHIAINRNCETFYPGSEKIRPGIFAAGDATDCPFKQIIVAAGEGAKAALQAYSYVKGVKTAIMADWAHK
ncbi:MAG: FAD-dependent oxidoreductase [Candidatus Aenigmatarchaeota archaeon]